MLTLLTVGTRSNVTRDVDVEKILDEIHNCHMACCLSLCSK